MMMMDDAMTDGRRGRPKSSSPKKEVLQVALDPRTRRAVMMMAEEQNRSVSDVLRELVARGLGRRKRRTQSEGVEQ